MQIIKKSSSGLQSLPLDAMLMAQRTIFLTEGITAEAVNRVLQQLLFLESEDSQAPIKLIINSPGGVVSEGLVLYDQIKGMTVPIEMYCVGLAASMAAVLLAGGQKGRRYILRHSKVMVHEPLLLNGMGGSATSIQRTAESILEIKKTLNGLLAADTGRTMDEINAATTYDHYLSAKEAVEFGICDKIVDRV